MKSTFTVNVSSGCLWVGPKSRGWELNSHQLEISPAKPMWPRLNQPKRSLIPPQNPIFMFARDIFHTFRICLNPCLVPYWLLSKGLRKLFLFQTIIQIKIVKTPFASPHNFIELSAVRSIALYFNATSTIISSL
jgi:hypothetical protein